MFVHGGMAGEQIFNDVHVLNLSKSFPPTPPLSFSHLSLILTLWKGVEQLPPPPPPPCIMNMQLYNVLINIKINVPATTDKWVWSHPKVKGVAVPPLAAHGCAVIRTKLYMFGGLTPTGSASDQLYALDTGMYMYMYLSLVDINTIYCIEV